MSYLLLYFTSLVLSGHIRANHSHEPIPYAAIDLNGRFSTLADAAGHFRIVNAAAGPATLHVHALGFRDTTIILQISSDTILDVAMDVAPVAAAPLLVAAPTNVWAPGPDPTRIDAARLNNLPHIGEPDVLRAVTDLPSVSTASDFSTALYIRGGTPDQAEITLDGAPLLNPYHLGGLFTAIDPNIVSSIDLSAGALPAQASGFGTLLNIATREGDRDAVHTDGALSLISAKASAEGPIGARGSFTFSGRRTYLDVFTEALHSARILKSQTPYRFVDAHGKLTFDVGKQGKLIAAAFSDAEAYHGSGSTSTLGGLSAEWLSRLALLRYSETFGARAMLDGSASISEFKATGIYGRDFAPSSDSALGNVDMRLIRLHAALSTINWNGETTIGLDVEHFSNHYDVASSGQLQRLFPRLLLAQHQTTLHAFVEREQKIGRVQLRTGIRGTNSVGGNALMPRFGVTWQATNRLAFFAGAGWYARSMRGLRNEESALARVFAYDLLMPGDTLQMANDVVVGTRVPTSIGRFSVQLYSRTGRRMNVPNPPADAEQTPLLSADWTVGRTKSNGLEFTHSGTFGGNIIETAYSLRSIQVSTTVATYKPSYARNQQLSLKWQHQMGRIVFGSLRGVIQSGLPFTPAAAHLQTYTYSGSAGGIFTPATDVVLLGRINTAALPVYSRIDVGFRRDGTGHLFGHKFQMRSSLDINNLLNTKNALWGLPRVLAQPRIEYGPQTPFLPTIGLEWRF